MRILSLFIILLLVSCKTTQMPPEKSSAKAITSEKSSSEFIFVLGLGGNGAGATDTDRKYIPLYCKYDNASGEGGITRVITEMKSKLSTLSLSASRLLDDLNAENSSCRTLIRMALVPLEFQLLSQSQFETMEKVSVNNFYVSWSRKPIQSVTSAAASSDVHDVSLDDFNNFSLEYLKVLIVDWLHGDDVDISNVLNNFCLQDGRGYRLGGKANNESSYCSLSGLSLSYDTLTNDEKIHTMNQILSLFRYGRKSIAAWSPVGLNPIQLAKRQNSLQAYIKFIELTEVPEQ